MKNTIPALLIFVVVTALCSCADNDRYPAINSELLTVSESQMAIVKGKTEAMCRSFLETEYPKMHFAESDNKVFISIDEFHAKDNKMLFRFAFSGNCNRGESGKNVFTSHCSGNAAAIINGDKVVVSIIPVSYGYGD